MKTAKRETAAVLEPAPKIKRTEHAVRVKTLKQKRRNWHSELTGYDDLRIVTFPNEKSLDAGLKTLVENSSLIGVPFRAADAFSLLVPGEAVRVWLQNFPKALKVPEVRSVFNVNSLDPRHAAKMRAKAHFVYG